MSSFSSELRFWFSEYSSVCEETTISLQILRWNFEHCPQIKGKYWFLRKQAILLGPQGFLLWIICYFLRPQHCIKWATWAHFQYLWTVGGVNTGFRGVWGRLLHWLQCFCICCWPLNVPNDKPDRNSACQWEGEAAESIGWLITVSGL